MDLRQLAVVVAVAEEGGFTAAAQRLHTVQSTVSTVVRALERDLGTPLFHRTTHRVTLTPAGEAFVPAARAALEAVERARAAISPVRGRVRLGLVPGLLLDLHRVLAAVRDAHPGLVVEVRQLTADSLEEALAKSTVDIALGVFTAADAGLGLVAPRDTAANTGLGSAAPRDTAGAGLGPIDPQDTTATGLGLADPQDTAGAGLGPIDPQDTAATGLDSADPQDTAATGLGPADPQDTAGAGLGSADPRDTAGAGLGSPGSSGAPGPAGGAPDPGTGTGSGGLGFAPLPDSGGLVTTPLAGEELVLATAPGGSRSAPGDLSALSLVDFPAGWAIRDVVDRAFADRRVSLEADDLTAAVSLVRAGLAACVLPASAAARFPEVTVRRFAAPPLWQLTAIHREAPPAAVTAVLAHLG